MGPHLFIVNRSFLRLLFKPSFRAFPLGIFPLFVPTSSLFRLADTLAQLDSR